MHVFVCQDGILLQTVISFSISEALEIKPPKGMHVITVETIKHSTMN